MDHRVQECRQSQTRTTMQTVHFSPRPLAGGAAAATNAAAPVGFQWPEGGVTRVPFQVFSDPAIYALEQEKIFRGPVWHYLCLETEVRRPGDIKTTWLGDTPIIVTRDENG